MNLKTILDPKQNPKLLLCSKRNIMAIVTTVHKFIIILKMRYILSFVSWPFVHLRTISSFVVFISLFYVTCFTFLNILYSQIVKYILKFYKNIYIYYFEVFAAVQITVFFSISILMQWPVQRNSIHLNIFITYPVTLPKLWRGFH